MEPFSYSRCATDVVYLVDNPSLREPSCCSVVVRNGAYGERRYGLRSTLDTLKLALASCRRLASAAAPAASRCSSGCPVPAFSSPVERKSGPWATRAPSTDSSVAVKLVGL